MAHKITPWKDWNIFVETSSESSEDDLLNRRIYARVRNRLRSSDSETSCDDDARYNEIRYGEIIRQKNFNKTKHIRKPLAVVQKTSTTNRSRKNSTVYQDLYKGFSKISFRDKENLDLDKGIVKLAICGSVRRITITVLELRVFGQEFDHGNTYIKVELCPTFRSRDVFKTKTLRCRKESSMVFHETFSFERPVISPRTRIMISAWSRRIENGNFQMVGCTSFGLQKILDKQEIIQGTYYLLSENLGKRKHLLASSQNIKRCSNKVSVGLYHNIPKAHSQERSIDQTQDEESTKLINITTDLSSDKISRPFSLVRNSSQISFVDERSIAFYDGLREGDDIVKINQQTVKHIGIRSLWDIIINSTGTLQLIVKRSHQDLSNTIRRNPGPRKSTLLKEELNPPTSTPKEAERRAHRHSTHEKLQPHKVGNTKLPGLDLKESMNGHNGLVVATSVASFAPKCAKIISNKQSYKIYEENRNHDAHCNLRLKKHSPIVDIEVHEFQSDNNIRSPTSDGMSLSSDSGISETIDGSTAQEISKIEFPKTMEDSSTNTRIKPFFLTSWLRHKDQNKSFLSNMQEELRNMSTPERLRLLPKVLQSKKEIRLFRTYMESVYSDENIDFWLECQEYKRCTQRKQSKMASKIFTTYIGPKSAKEVNITFEVRSKIERNLDNAGDNLFNEAQESIYSLMETGTFLQYLQSIISS